LLVEVSSYSQQQSTSGGDQIHHKETKQPSCVRHYHLKLRVPGFSSRPADRLLRLSYGFSQFI